MRRLLPVLVVPLVAVLATGCSSGGDDATSEYGVAAPDALQLPAPATVPETVPDPTTGTFVDVGRNPFVTTAEDAQSTFALDVDTGSYSVSRELVAQGVLPPAAAVRTEEWVNAFDYGYRVPQGDDFAVVTGAVPAALTGTEGTELVRVGLAAREVADDDRPPAAVTFVVDVSGSMEGEDRIGLVQDSLEVLAENLRPERHRVGRDVRERGAAAAAPDRGGRPRQRPRRGARSADRREHQPGGRRAARLRAGAGDVPGGRRERRGARLRRRRQRR